MAEVDEHEYVVVSRNREGGTWKVAGPYSRRQARVIAGQTLGANEVVRIVRPTYWLAEDDDLDRFQPRTSVGGSTGG